MLHGDSDSILAIQREEQQSQVPIFTVVPGTVRQGPCNSANQGKMSQKWDSWYCYKLAAIPSVDSFVSILQS